MKQSKYKISCPPIQNFLKRSCFYFAHACFTTFSTIGAKTPTNSYIQIRLFGGVHFHHSIPTLHIFSLFVTLSPVHCGIVIIEAQAAYRRRSRCLHKRTRVFLERLRGAAWASFIHSESAVAVLQNNAPPLVSLATEAARACGHFRRTLIIQSYQLTRVWDVHRYGTVHQSARRRLCEGAAVGSGHSLYCALVKEKLRRSSPWANAQFPCWWAWAKICALASKNCVSRWPSAGLKKSRSKAVNIFFAPREFCEWKWAKLMKKYICIKISTHLDANFWNVFLNA